MFSGFIPQNLHLPILNSFIPLILNYNHFSATNFDDFTMPNRGLQSVTQTMGITPGSFLPVVPL